jgi:hypothetical protein
MVMHRPPPPDRRLAGDYEACGSTLLGAYHEGPITLAISQNTMSDNAGCTARYVASGPQLSLQLADTPSCGNAPPEHSRPASGDRWCYFGALGHAPEWVRLQLTRGTDHKNQPWPIDDVPQRHATAVRKLEIEHLV